MLNTAQPSTPSSSASPGTPGSQTKTVTAVAKTGLKPTVKIPGVQGQVHNQVQSPQTPRLKPAQPLTVVSNTSGVITANKTLMVATPTSLPGGVGTPNQIIVSNPGLVQQLASGKAQIASIGGHQVVIRSTPTGKSRKQVGFCWLPW